MYSLVSASVLACDLARHPSGAAVADVVDRALSFDVLPDAPAASDDVRQRVLSRLVGAPRMSRLMDGVTSVLADGLPDASTSRTIVAALSETPLGGLEDLHAMLREELSGQGVQAALDAVTAAWATHHAGLRDLIVLRAPWDTVAGEMPAALPMTPYRDQVVAVLEQIASRTPEQWSRVAQAHARRRGTFAWSTAMHASCWAAYDAGRTRDVARAQLAAARSLRLAGASTGPDAHAIAMATTAAIQASATVDLLDTASLREPWEAGS